MARGYCPACGAFSYAIDDAGCVEGGCGCPRCDECGRQTSDPVTVADSEGEERVLCERCWTRGDSHA
jgi:hypothetical protein